MSSQQITFFDLPSRPPQKAWSLNPWKIRLYLNYKNIPYRTEWIEYPDLVSRLSPHMAPNPQGAFAPYTIPTVILPNGTYVQESLVIARKLEELFPTPALKIDTPRLEILQQLVGQIMPPAAPEYFYKIPQRLLNQASATWWYPDREKRVGVTSLEEFHKEKGGSVVSNAVAPHVKKVAELLQETSGPYFEGEQVTFADFVWAGLLQFFMTIGQDCFDTVICEEQEVHLKFFKACAPWLERDDH